MWIPDSAEQIVECAKNHDLHETASFDTKAPDALDSTKEIAKDIAAMSTDGGVILYGVGEDEHENPTLPQPFELEGTKERVSNVVQTCIQPPPQFEVIPFPLGDTPSEGFVAVRVPPSPEAPHMVTKNNDSRYYGRNGPRNVRLDAAQVERLFRRRERLSSDRQSLLEELSDHATIKPVDEREKFGYLRIALKPAIHVDGLLKSVLDPTDGQSTNQRLMDLIREVEEEVSFTWDTGDTFMQRSNWSKKLSGYSAHLNRYGENRDGNPIHAKRFDAWLGFDGSMYFNAGAIAKEVHGGRVFLEGAAVILTVKFLHFAGLLLNQADYSGPVDIAIRASGLKGARSGLLGDISPVMGENPLDESIYTNNLQCYVRTLTNDPVEGARSLIGHLIDVSSEGNGEELFEQDAE